MNDAPPIDNLNGNGNISQQQREMNNSIEVSNHDPNPRDDYPPNNGNGGNSGNDAMIGSSHLRPVFMGNLEYGCTVEDLEDLFKRPLRGMEPIPIDRVDLKRGYAFVFFQEARSQNDKDRLERYVDEINGM